MTAETARASKPPRQRRARPAYVLLIAGTVAFRVGREILDLAVLRRFGPAALFVVAALGAALVVAWRVLQRRRVGRAGGVEFTPELVREQIEDAGLTEPRVADDGSLLGASALVVNQRPKVLELRTEYEVFGRAGERIGGVRQIAQSRTRAIFRLVTPIDQFFTHHFEIEDADGRVVLRLTRPRKLFKTRVLVFAGDDRYLGSIEQRNVFGKIRFDLVDAAKRSVGELRARNLRAWDFDLVDAADRLVGTVYKSWEGWAQTAFTRADRYVVGINRPLDEPLGTLIVAAALTVDLALKQDARGFG